MPQVSTLYCSLSVRRWRMDSEALARGHWTVTYWRADSDALARTVTRWCKQLCVGADRDALTWTVRPWCMDSVALAQTVTRWYRQ